MILNDDEVDVFTRSDDIGPTRRARRTHRGRIEECENLPYDVRSVSLEWSKSYSGGVIVHADHVSVLYFSFESDTALRLIHPNTSENFHR